MLILLLVISMFSHTMDQEEFLRRLNVPNLSMYSPQNYNNVVSPLIDARNEKIVIKEDKRIRYSVEQVGELIKQYPITSETFNYIMSHTDDIFPAINKKNITANINPYTPVILKASINRLEGLTIANRAINQIPFCSIDTPIKEAMLFSTEKGKMISCVVSHQVIGNEPNFFSLKNTQDLYKFCKLSKFVDGQRKNFVDCGTDKRFLVDTGMEGFDEEPRENFKGFTAGNIRYQLRNILDKKADTFLVNKIKKHGYLQ